MILGALAKDLMNHHQLCAYCATLRGAMLAASYLPWTAQEKLVVIVTDAPCHGKDSHFGLLVTWFRKFFKESKCFSLQILRSSFFRPGIQLRGPWSFLRSHHRTDMYRRVWVIAPDMAWISLGCFCVGNFGCQIDIAKGTQKNAQFWKTPARGSFPIMKSGNW